MMDFRFFGSMTNLNFAGKGKSNSKSQNNQKDSKQNVTRNETPESTKTVAKELSSITASDLQPKEEGRSSFRSFLGLHKLPSDDRNSPGSVKKETATEMAGPKTEDVDDQEVEARDKFEMTNTTFYKVLTKSFYEQHIDHLQPFRKQDNGLKSSPKREKRSTRTLRDRKLVISSPQNFQRIENELTMTLRREADTIGRMLKKSSSMDNLLRDSDDFTNRLSELDKGKLSFGSVQDLGSQNTNFRDSVGSNSSETVTTKTDVMSDEGCLSGELHTNEVGQINADDKKSDYEDEACSESDYDEHNRHDLIVMRNMSQSTPVSLLIMKMSCLYLD